MLAFRLNFAQLVVVYLAWFWVHTRGDDRLDTTQQSQEWTSISLGKSQTDTPENVDRIGECGAMNFSHISEWITPYPVVKINCSGPTVQGEIDPRKEAQSYILYKIGEFFHLVWMPIAIVGGFVGNTLSFIVMIQPHNRDMAMCVYMAVLAASDNVVLLVATHQYITITILNRPMQLFECQVDVFLGLHFQPFGAYLVAAMTLNRFVAVRFPFKAATFCTTKRAKITMALILTFLLTYNFLGLYTARVIERNSCVGVGTKDLIGTVYSYLTTILNSLVPFVSILFMNIGIISAVRTRNKYFNADKRAHAEDTEGNPKDQHDEGKKKNKDAQLGAMLFLVSFALLFFTAPLFIRYLVTATFDYTRNAQTYAGFWLLYHISNKFLWTNSAVNFYLYIVAGSKFREDLKYLICGRPNTGTSLSSVSQSHSMSSIVTTT